jgi:uncharacterized membrane protein YfcA
LDEAPLSFFLNLPEFSSLEWLMAAMIGVCVGAAKAGLPGIGLLVVPIMTEIFPARYSTGVLLPMLIIADVCAVKVYHRHADWSRLWKLFPPTLVGVVLGYFAMGQVNDAQFKVTVGLTVLLMAVLMILNKKGWIAKGKVPEGTHFAIIAGVLVGMTTMMANAAGPIAAIYFLALRLEKTEFIGTSAWFFLLVNVFKLPFSYHLGFIDQQSLSFNVVQVPVIVMGIALGLFVVKRLSHQLFFKMVLTLTIFSACRLLWIW